MNYNQQLQALFHQYEREHPGTVPQVTDVAAWMIREGKWKPKQSDLISRCAEDVADALRQEYRTDRRGRKYRANHAVRSKQGTLWADIDTAPRAHMERAFGQRRKQIVGDCVQLRTDVDVYNDKRQGDVPINLVLDFTEDVAEALAFPLADRAA